MNKLLLITGLAGLLATTAALGQDAIALQAIDDQKQSEASSTAELMLSASLKPMPVTVLSSNGAMRHVGVTLMDLREVNRPTLLGAIRAPAVHGSAEGKHLAKSHPVVRIAGALNCQSGKARWTSLDHTDTPASSATKQAAITTPTASGNLPSQIDPSALAAICALKPAHT